MAHRVSSQQGYAGLYNCHKIALWSIDGYITNRHTYIVMAERVGFEPTVGFPRHTLSKRAPSTTRTPLHRMKLNQTSTNFRPEEICGRPVFLEMSCK